MCTQSLEFPENTWIPTHKFIQKTGKVAKEPANFLLLDPKPLSQPEHPPLSPQTEAKQAVPDRQKVGQTDRETFRQSISPSKYHHQAHCDKCSLRLFVYNKYTATIIIITTSNSNNNTGQQQYNRCGYEATT